MKKQIKEKLSIIVPCYNEEQSLPYFYQEITNQMKKNPTLEFELIFIDDRSKDKTLEVLKQLEKKEKQVRYLSFSSNFGKEAAMYSGLEYAKGDYITIMDANLQDSPALLEEMYRSIKEEEYDCVGTRRVTRKGILPIRSFFARQFYKIINRYSKGIFSLISFIMMITIIIKTLALGDNVIGWPSMACILFFIGGIQLFCMGIIGQYLSKTYLETKKRPIYIIGESSDETK